MVRIRIETTGKIRVMKNNVYETEMKKNRERNIILKLQQEYTTESHFFA